MQVHMWRRARRTTLAGLVLAPFVATVLIISPAVAVDEPGAQQQETSAPATTDSTSTSPGLVDAEAVVDSDAGAVLDGTIMLPFGSEFSMFPGSRTTVSFAIPAGLTAVAFDARVLGAEATALEVSQGGRAITTIALAADRVLAPLDGAEVSAEGTLTLAFTLAGPTGTWCAVDGIATSGEAPVVVRDAALALVGSAELPTSVADFFSDSVTTAIVDIPSGANEDLTAAGISLVAAASHALGQNSTVRLSVDGIEKIIGDFADSAAESDVQTPVFARRVVQLVPGTGAVATAIDRTDDGIARLTLTGAPDELLAAARAFALDGIALASAAETEGLAARVEPTAARTTLTLDELGVGRVMLEGYGVHDAYIGVAQGSFGRTLTGIDIALRGTSSSTSATIATVQLLWNDVLVDSFVIDPSEAQFERTISVPAAALRSGNGLVIRMQAVTANSECIADSLLPQVRLDIDPVTSTVTGTGGVPAVAGFSDFPQAFSGSALLAFGTGVTPVQQMAAADLIAALQRATPEPINVEVVPADELISGSTSGVLIGATPEQTQRLRTPLRLAETRLISDAAGELTVAVEQPFAALQAVREGGRSLLVLGAVLGDDSDPDGVLATAVSGLEGTAWWSLDGSVRLASPNSAPVLIDINEVVPQDAAKADFEPIVWWALGGVILLMAVGLIAAGIRARRKRAARERVEAEIAVSEIDAEIARELTDETRTAEIGLDEALSQNDQPRGPAGEGRGADEVGER